jgi:hypothetical protein
MTGTATLPGGTYESTPGLWWTCRHTLAGESSSPARWHENQRRLNGHAPSRQNNAKRLHRAVGASHSIPHSMETMMPPTTQSTNRTPVVFVNGLWLHAESA